MPGEANGKRVDRQPPAHKELKTKKKLLATGSQTQDISGSSHPLFGRSLRYYENNSQPEPPSVPIDGASTSAVSTLFHSAHILPQRNFRMVLGIRLFPKLRKHLQLRNPSRRSFVSDSKSPPQTELPSAPMDDPPTYESFMKAMYIGDTNTSVPLSNGLNTQRPSNSGLTHAHVISNSIPDSDVDKQQLENGEKFSMIQPSPLDAVLEHILLKSSAELAVVHSDDLDGLLPDGVYINDFEKWLDDVSPKIYLIDDGGTRWSNCH
ncbi:hypothetical protein K439DRAFT_1611662 [Ramaria rubella]|nr:hypothetical protein K439DRAFT_1611662 [Ramaria rubella]